MTQAIYQTRQIVYPFDYGKYVAVFTQSIYRYINLLALIRKDGLDIASCILKHRENTPGKVLNKILYVGMFASNLDLHGRRSSWRSDVKSCAQSDDQKQTPSYPIVLDIVFSYIYNQCHISSGSLARVKSSVC